jgi:hypothetical protein
MTDIVEHVSPSTVQAVRDAIEADSLIREALLPNEITYLAQHVCRIVAAAEIVALRSENEALRAHVRDLQAACANSMTPGVNDVDYGARDTRAGNGED